MCAPTGSASGCSAWPKKERLPRSAYAADIGEIVYATCRKRAALALEAGRTVILDAVHARPEERDNIAAVAAEAGVPFVGLWLDAPGTVLKQRLRTRALDASDATPAVVDQQLTYDIGRQTFALIDASEPLEHVVRGCLRKIEETA